MPPKRSTNPNFIQSFCCCCFGKNLIDESKQINYVVVCDLASANLSFFFNTFFSLQIFTFRPVWFADMIFPLRLGLLMMA